MQGLESVDNWTRGELEHILWEKTRGIASHDKQISWLQGSLDEVRTRGDQAKADFYRAREEKAQLEGTVASQRKEMASMKAELVTLQEALMTKERSLRTTAARCKELEGMVNFWDEADVRREILRKKELEELKKDKEMIEASRSQARIAWDQHEKVSSELAVV